MAALRTRIVLVLLLNICGHYCNNIEDIKTDLLLRGSEELTDDEEAPQRSYLQKDLETEPPSKIDSEEVKNDDTKEFDYNLTSTTEYTTFTEAEETLPTTISAETTDSNHVYDDGNSYDNTTHVELKPETTSSTTPATTKAAEDIEAVSPGVANLDEDHEFSQRVPKLSDNMDPHQQERRNFDPKPVPTPSTSKSATLKGWLEDLWLRPPAGIMVPLRPMALSRALAVWNDLTVEGLNLSDIIIVGYDSNGVNWRSRHSLQPSSGSGQRTVAEALSKLLLKYQDVNTDNTPDGTMRALASASKLVPYDSALFVITDKGPGDAQKLPLALKALVEKRLKVYTIWTDPTYPSKDSEMQLLGLKNVSIHTEGEVLPYSLQVMDMDTNAETTLQQWEPLMDSQLRKGRVQDWVEDKFDTLLVRRGGGEAISVGVPVENGVSALRVYIEGRVEHAVLYPPNDAPQIDLYNESSVLAFSPKSRTDALSPRDVYLVFPGAAEESDNLSVVPMKPAASDARAPTAGVWHLSVRCDTCDYRLIVSARALVHFEATHPERKDTLKLRVVGPVASVRESVIIDEYGTELASLPFSYQPIAADGQEVPMEGPPAELIADVAMPNVKGPRIYAKIVGRDVRGEPFVRLSGPLNQLEPRMGRSASITFPESSNDLERAEEFSARVYNDRIQYNETSILPYGRAQSQIVNQWGSILTSVQIGLGTRLYGAPGANLQLQFEVTNHREQSVYFDFQAVGELRFLTGISPLRQTIASGQTVNVVVSLTISANAQPGARDLITFTAIGRNTDQVSISTYVYVTNAGQQLQDVWAPELRHNFQGSCIGRQGNDCAQHVWSATIVARDSNAGLLRLTSSPAGLVYDSNFVAGSREEVTAVYRATCCAPRVLVTAVDANGNANTQVVDISSFISEAGIAAIVLGVFLFIALIALIVFLIYWCVKRRRESRELPTYATSSSRNLS